MSDCATAYQELADFAVELVAAAGQLTLEHFGNSALAVDFKDDGSPVTLADRAAETLMREAIRQRYPNDTILGEEFGVDGPLANGATDVDDTRSHSTATVTERMWVLDPIDGTRSFTAGVPLYANLLAVVENGRPVVGVLNLPALSEMLWATHDGGAYCNGERCRVSAHDRVVGAYVMTSGVRYWPHGALDRLADAGAIVRTWGDAYGYALVATGRVEAMVDPLVEVWDVAPISLILAEAGGRFSDLSGAPRFDGGNGVGTNGMIHQSLIELLPAAGRPGR